MVSSVVIAASSPSVRRRLHGCLLGLDLVVVDVPLGGVSVETLPELGGICYVLHLPDLEGGEEEITDSLAAMPHPPSIILVTDTHDPEARARAIASGVAAVLDSSLPDDLLGRAMERVIVRRMESVSSEIPPDVAPDPEEGHDQAPDELLAHTLAEVVTAVTKEVERSYLTQALTRCRGRVGDAAALAGVSPRTLYGKMRDMGLRKERFKD